MTIGLLASAAPASAQPGSGSATGSATGSAQLATGSATGSADAASTGATSAYFAWQSVQFLQNTLRVLLAVPQQQLP
ncbi:hypothetical protein ACFO5K_15270 [Nocardia halotolerans]|uniref:Uncharacterized protein n=1 Tax=Nocardia halotolerans TaxID=1755878 RepID=A0ABV8VJL3_9NOCA